MSWLSGNALAAGSLATAPAHPVHLVRYFWYIGTRDMSKARHTEPAYANMAMFVSMLPSASLDGAIGSLLYLPEI